VVQVKALPDVTSELNIGLSFEHFDFNFKNPHLANAGVRRAIATGLNVQALVDRTVKQFSDKAAPLGNRIWLTGQPQYQDHFGQYGKGDTAGATSTTAGNQLRETQEQLIQAQMKDIGIDIKIANADNRKLFGEWLPGGNFDIANFGWVGRARQPDRPAADRRHGHHPALRQADVSGRAQHLHRRRRQRHPGRPVLELQPLGPEGRLAGTPRMLPGETLSRAGGWLGDLPGASPMVVAAAP
jgi:ABC-type transport system substrate-binding protein